MNLPLNSSFPKWSTAHSTECLTAFCHLSSNVGYHSKKYRPTIFDSLAKPLTSPLMLREIKMASMITVIVVLISFLLQFSSPVLARDRPSPKQWYSFTLSFGKNNGTTRLPQQKLDRFIRNVVMPRIDGFKLVETQGVWKGQTEESFDIVVLSNDFNVMVQKLRKIGCRYKKTFRQDSVLFYYVKATVSFL